jgi:tetratricopeptide (TPR) repeat protein
MVEPKIGHEAIIPVFGIMGRMENANLDETRPTPTGDETLRTQTNGNASTSEEATRPTPASQDVQSTAATIPVPVKTASAEASNAETIPVSVGTPGGQVPSTTDGSEGSPRRAWFWLIALSIFALLVIAAASAWGGYRAGINERLSSQAALVAQQVKEQYDLGVQDMQAQRYEVARQRFEYVIRLAPNYPGVTDKLAAVLLELNITATPTVVPTPTLTPTPDLRSVEELYTQSQQLLADKNWTEAIDTLLKLRKNDPNYQAVKVDSMLYVALRNRGVQKILNDADLEGGTYDLALAESFGPLDVEATNYRSWADLYVTGASFWEIDWQQAAYYFGQLLQVAPNLRDASNMTATERFRQATIKYGDTLAQNKDWCAAEEQYTIALNYGPDPSVQPTATWVSDKCANGDSSNQNNKSDQKATEVPPTETPLPTATSQPQASATPKPTQEPTQPGQPTATPAPPTATSEPPTAAPPTATSEPPTAAPPTATSEPPTATSEPPTAKPPTATSEPPTPKPPTPTPKPTEAVPTETSSP